MPFYDSTYCGGYGFDSLGLWGWWGSRGTATPADEPKQPETPKEGTAPTNLGMTGASVAAMSNGGYGGFPGYGCRRPVTVQAILEALRDPVIAACHAYATGPIRVGKSHLVEQDDAPEGAKEFIEKATKHLLPRYLEDAVWCVPFGWAGWQVEWERVDGSSIIKRLHACRQEWSGVLYDKDTGEHVGLKFDGTDIFGLRQFILTNDRRGSKDYLGRSRVENVIKAVDDWIEENNKTAQLASKAAGVILKQGYPPGPNGDTTNKATAEAFAKRATSGASWITYPTWGGFTIEQLTRMTPDQIVAFSKATDWTMDTLDLGSQGPAIDALTTDKRYLDELKCLGYGVPPQAILSASTSNRATSEAAGGYGTAMNETVNQGVYAAFNEHVIDAMLVLEYGEEARGTVRLDPEPLEDPQALFDRQILQAAMSSSNPDVQRDVGERDWGAVYDRNGVPKLAEDEIAKRKEEKATAAADAMKQQQDLAAAKGGANGQPAANGKADANGKPAISLSAERMERMFVDHVAAPTPPPVVNIAAGAFQVTVPEQPAAQISVPAPVVNVTLPKPGRVVRTLTRDKDGKPTGSIEEPIDE